jgi:hypothetical protein
VACDEHGNGGNCINIFVPKLKKGDHTKDLDVNGEIILKLILKKWSGRTWPVFL